MTIEEYATFSLKLNQDVIKIRNKYWIRLNRFFIHSYPTMDVMEFDYFDLDALKTSGAHFAILTINTEKSNSGEYILRTNSYAIENFNSKTRNQIRKGLKSCTFKELVFSEVFERGFEINCQTLGRHKRRESYLNSDKELWKEYISKYFLQKDVFVYGAFVNNTLAAYLILLKVEEKFIIRHPFADKSFSSNNPMNALLYYVINKHIEIERNITITYGLESLLPMPSLEHFKNNMLFEKKSLTRYVYPISFIAKFLLSTYVKSIIQTFHMIKIIDDKKFNLYIYLFNSYRVNLKN